jgi:hypothetical protein
MITLTLADGSTVELQQVTPDMDVVAIADNATGLDDGVIMRYVTLGRAPELSEMLDIVTERLTPSAIKALIDDGLAIDSIARGVDNISLTENVDDWIDNNEDSIFGDFVNHSTYQFVRDAINPDEFMQMMSPDYVTITDSGEVVDYSGIM